ncbi:MAG TPA: peptidylprolyl isomerase [Dysgonomonas sp.]|nr:peptidylprolyl isomerase [Dysgonomonas sp.]
MTGFRKAILFLSFFSLFISWANAQDNIVDEIVWVVGDEAILKSEVEEIRLQMQLERQRFDGDPYCLIPEQLAYQKLFLHQAKADSIDIPLAEINRMVDMRINNIIASVGSREKLEEYLGKSVAQYREELRDQTRDNQIVETVQRNIAGTVKLTPSEIRNYYMELPHDSLPFIPTTVEAEIITMLPHIPIQEIDAVKNRLREFTDEINAKNKRDFSTLAILYSEDKGSSTRGGELGFLGRTSLVPEFANAAFSLTDPTKVSNIVETEYGFHIIQLIEKRGDRINARHILLKPKIPAEEVEKTVQRMDSLRKDILAQKFTFEDAALHISADKDTRNNRGLMVNMEEQSNYGGTSRFVMQDLPAEVATVVEKLKVGEISEPFVMQDYKGKQTIAIVRLKNRVEAHRANLSDDYQIMKMIVEGQKRNDVIKKWVENKIKSTYIRINDNWKNCDFQFSGWIKE